jgi:hypothetical protein
MLDKELQDLHVARHAAKKRRCPSDYICTIHIDLATVKQSFHALEMAILTGDMNRPRPIVYCLRAIYAVNDEQRQAFCVAKLAGLKRWGKTCVIGLVQLGAVVNEQGQAFCVAILAGNICWGITFIRSLVQLGAVIDEQRQAFCVAILAGKICWGKTLNLPVDIYAA